MEQAGVVITVGEYLKLVCGMPPGKRSASKSLAKHNDQGVFDSISAVFFHITKLSIWYN